MPEYVQNTKTRIVHRATCPYTGRPLRRLGEFFDLEIASIEAGNWGGPAARTCDHCEQAEH